jgi:hypothetical protein
MLILHDCNSFMPASLKFTRLQGSKVLLLELSHKTYPHISVKYTFQQASLDLFQRRIVLLGMRAPHLTGNVLVRGDRPSLLVGTDGKDGRADAEDADVRDGRVALP